MSLSDKITTAIKWPYEVSECESSLQPNLNPTLNIQQYMGLVPTPPSPTVIGGYNHTPHVDGLNIRMVQKTYYQRIL